MPTSSPYRPTSSGPYNGYYFTFGTDAPEWFFGSSANDWIDGGGGNDVILAGGGDDVLHGGAGDDMLHGGDGVDRLFGGEGDDILVGGKGEDRLEGGEGDDTFMVTADDLDAFDTFFGGNGSDTVSFENLDGHIWIALNSEYGFVNSHWFEVENLRGSAGNDWFYGDDFNNRLEGMAGIDALDGRAGNDTLEGGFGDDMLRGAAGTDTLIGGEGADTFQYMTWTEADDIIADFTVGIDRIALSGPGFGLVSLDEIDFFVGTDVHATDRAALLYNPETGVLSFDLDGEFGSDAVVLATLAGSPEISKNDFVLLAGADVSWWLP